MRQSLARFRLAVLAIFVSALVYVAAGCGSGGGGSTTLLYALNTATNSIDQYRLNSDSSTTPLSTPTVSTGAAPKAFAVDSTGNFVYVANSGDNNISQYQVGANGSLTPMTPPTVASGVNPTAIAIHPSGKFIYVACSGDNTIHVYSVTGRARDVRQQQVLIESRIIQTNQNFTRDLGIDWTGNHLYAINSGSNNISQFNIASDGNLNPLNPPTVSLPASPSVMAVNPHGPSFYVLCPSLQLLVHAIVSPSGTVNLQLTPQVNTGPNPTSIAVDPTGRSIFTTNAGDNTLSVAYMNNGILQALNQSSRASILSNPRVVTIRDSETVILGGAQVGHYEKATATVPALGDIPILGNLFRTNTTAHQSDELLIFITPQVIQDNQP